MNSKVYIAIIIVLLVIILVLIRKKIWNIIKNIVNNFFKSKFCLIVKNLIQKFFYKLVELVTILLLVLILLAPVFTYCILNKLNIISFTDYKELLEITLNSKFIIVTPIIIILYVFRAPIKIKLGQLKNAGKNGLEFYPDTQAQKMLNINESLTEDCENEYHELDVTDSIYSKVKAKLNSGKNINRQSIPSLEETNENLRQKIDLLECNLKKEKFKNIKNNMAKTTNTVLLFINGQYKCDNSFGKDYIKLILKGVYKNVNIDWNLEVNAIYNFLQNNNFIDTEDDQHFSINENGSDFLKYLFEGGE